LIHIKTHANLTNMKTSKSMESASLDLNEHKMKNSSRKLALLRQKVDHT
jgi:hypothetical protein